MTQWSRTDAAVCLKARFGVYCTWTQFGPEFGPKSERKFLSGDKKMTTSTSNRHTSNTDDNVFETGHSHGITTLMVLDYPSLIGNSWDDELLPSGD